MKSRIQFPYPNTPMCCLDIKFGRYEVVFQFDDGRSLRVPSLWLEWLLQSPSIKKRGPIPKITNKDLLHYALSEDGRVVRWPLFDVELFIPDLFNTEISNSHEYEEIKWRQEHFVPEPKADARRVVVGKHYLTVEAVDGRIVSWPMNEFPFLQQASVKKRQNFDFDSSHGVTIYWPDLEEYLSVNFLFGHPCR